MTPQELVQSFEKSAQFIARKLHNPSIDAAIVLGSGLHTFVENLSNPTYINFDDIPHFPRRHVQGHGQQLVLGHIQDKKVLLFTGRFHYYQGVPITTAALPAWISYYLNVPRYLVTNAAGGVNPQYNVGDLTLIKDHINPTGLNPLRGVHLDTWKDPFFDTSNLYNQKLREMLLKQAVQQNLSIRQGTYCFLTGPNYETPAEIQMLRTWGVDLVGMSTVPECLAAHKLGLKVLGLSVVTNVYPLPHQQSSTVSHQEVLDAILQASSKLNDLMKGWIATW